MDILTRRTAALGLAFLLVAALLPLPRAGAAGGHLDRSFGSDGTVVTAVGDTRDEGRAVAIQDDGKIVVAGFSQRGGRQELALVRYLPDGTLDGGFGADGIRTHAVGPTAVGRGIAVDGDTILVAGEANDGSGSDVALWRFGSDGSLLTETTTDVGSTSDVGYAVGVQDDGKVVVAGSSHNGTSRDVVLVRYLPDATTLDAAFDGDGIVRRDVTLGHDEAHALALQPDGGIAVAGYASPGGSRRFLVARYLVDGTPDPAFGVADPETGTVTAAHGTAWALTAAEEGLVVVGHGFHVVRLRSDGSLDDSFASGGIVQVPAGAAGEAFDVASLPEGRLLVVGKANDGDNDHFTLARLLGDGQLDGSFGDGGVVTTAVGARKDEARAVAVQPDGRMVAAGYASSDVETAFAVARYHPRPVVDAPPPKPDGGGQTNTGGSGTGGGSQADEETATDESDPAEDPSPDEQTAGEDDAAGQESDAATPPGDGGAAADPATGGASSASVERLWGADRVRTAIAASQDSFAAGGAGAVVLARADDFADALAGTPLAVARNAPLLLTHSRELHGATREELMRVLPSGRTVYLLGGPVALHESVADAVTQAGYDVVRYAGQDRFTTAIDIASRGLGDPSTLMVATGRRFPDALGAGAAAANVNGAVLLTDDERLPAAVGNYFDDHAGAQRFAIGGPAARALPSATAVVGEDRYATSAAIARRFFVRPTRVGVATGEHFPDALAGGAHVGRHGGPLVLTRGSALSDVTGAYLSDNRGSLHHAYLYGGEQALAPAVHTAVREAIG